MVKQKLDKLDTTIRECPVLIIGAGIGGLAAGAALARAGLPPLVLDAHVYPGGCAATFRHRGYWFDAGATLASGFAPGGPMDLLQRTAGISQWPVRQHEPALVVHLPDGSAIPRWGNERRWETYRYAFGAPSLAFWQWQERTAQPLWELATCLPPWPPQHIGDMLTLGNLAWQKMRQGRLALQLLPEVFRTVAAHLPKENVRLRQFVDGQLLITAQASSEQTNALYGAAALDFTNRGVVSVQGGIGTIAQVLCQHITQHQGTVLLRQEVTRIDCFGPHQFRVMTNRGLIFHAETVIANVTPWTLASLLHPLPRVLQRVVRRPPNGWSAFVLYLGVDAQAIPSTFPLHHQIIVDGQLGEGHTLFLSISPPWDETRAPKGHRALTVSTHTRWEPWWQLYHHDPEGYATQKRIYTERILDGITRVLPAIREALRLIVPGTPVSFARFTRRPFGWVGGFPQTRFGRAVFHQLTPGLWLVGDSTFPGQSLAAAALSGLTVAQAVLQEQEKTLAFTEHNWPYQ